MRTMQQTRRPSGSSFELLSDRGLEEFLQVLEVSRDLLADDSSSGPGEEATPKIDNEGHRTCVNLRLDVVASVSLEKASGKAETDALVADHLGQFVLGGHLLTHRGNLLRVH